MSRLRLFIMLLALCVLLSAAVPPGLAQDQRPNVAFILDNDLRAISVSDNGPDGLTRLGELFLAQNTRNRIIRLDDPIPTDVDVVVLIGPQRRLQVEHVARLWQHLANGGNLLLALDPLGQANTETTRSGLNTLFTLDYGVSLTDALLVEPWFSLESVQDLSTSYLFAAPDYVTDHPIVAPLLAYDVPVLLWGARSFQVEAFGPDSSAASLLFTRRPYGEADIANIAREQAELEINIGTDILGEQTIGAIAENSLTGSRIAILGDSELFQNGYGLAVTGSAAPRYPGNRVFVERLLGWLLERPVEDWPTLPRNITWLALDGQGDDWANQTQLSTLQDDTGDASADAYDIQQVTGLRNEDYLYMRIETAAPPDPASTVSLSFDTTINSQPDIVVMAQAEGTTFRLVEDDTAAPLNDASIAIADEIEIRVPLRVINSGIRIPILCLIPPGVAPDDASVDCTEGNFNVPSATAEDAFDLRGLADGPLATLRTSGTVNLREGPDTTYGVVTVLSNGQVLAATGRNEAGDWVQVQNARYTGWVADFLLLSNHDLLSLPVVDAPAAG